MKLLELRHRAWFRRLLVVLTIVATILLAAHPELRLLLPVLDGLGLDLLVLLVGGHLLAYARPLMDALWRRAVKPFACAGYFSFIYLLGSMGPYFDGALTLRFRPARIEPPVC